MCARHGIIAHGEANNSVNSQTIQLHILYIQLQGDVYSPATQYMYKQTYMYCTLTCIRALLTSRHSVRWGRITHTRKVELHGERGGGCFVREGFKVHSEMDGKYRGTGMELDNERDINTIRGTGRTEKEGRGTG